jgi:iron complex outermembrane receptor protein
VSAELTARRRIAGRHLLTAGAEVRHQVVGDQTSEDNTGTIVDVRQPETMTGVYIQDEVRLAPWLIVNVGLRADRHPAFGTRTSPRVGAVLLPRPATSIKLLYGSAFRAPNPYERYYYRSMAERSLGPETIHNTEVVWEESLSTRVRTVLTAFKYRTDNTIEQGAIDTAWGPDIYFRNMAGVDSAGIEADVEISLQRGFTARASHTFAHTTDIETGAAVSNSPRHVAKFGIQVPIGGAFISLDSQYIGERLTLGGEALPGFFLPNLTVTTPDSRRLDLSVSV